MGTSLSCLPLAVLGDSTSPRKLAGEEKQGVPSTDLQSAALAALTSQAQCLASALGSPNLHHLWAYELYKPAGCAHWYQRRGWDPGAGTMTKNFTLDANVNIKPSLPRWTISSVSGKFRRFSKPETVVDLVESVPGVDNALDLIHAWNLRTWKAEAGGSGSSRWSSAT